MSSHGSSSLKPPARTPALKPVVVRQPHSYGFENGYHAVQGRVAHGRERTVKLCRVQVCLFGQGLHAAERLRHLAQHGQQFGLVTIGQDAVDDLQRQGRIAAVQLGHRFVMRSASYHPVSVASPANSPPYGGCPHPTCACHRRAAVLLADGPPDGSALCSPAPRRCVVLVRRMIATLACM